MFPPLHERVDKIIYKGLVIFSAYVYFHILYKGLTICYYITMIDVYITRYFILKRSGL